jgi:hypothetical protein
MKTINRIFLFGDSWIEGQGTYDWIDEFGFQHELEIVGGDEHGERLQAWRKEISWNKPLRELTGCEIINHGRQGSDNYSQFQELNLVAPSLTENDLVVIGFTSKLRDNQNSLVYSWDKFDDNSTIMSRDNPLNGMIAWEKLSLEFCNFGLREDNKDHFSFATKNEREFTEKFIQDYYVSLYNDVVYEHIAQTNYYFLQERFKSLGLNLVCFDLFEPYVDKNYVSEHLHIDKNVYITYGEKTMNDMLQEYEINNIKDAELSLWECGHRRPDLKPAIYHPNQHGYKLIIDYVFKDVLPSHYQFKSK